MNEELSHFVAVSSRSTFREVFESRIDYLR